jgi:D-3-phosphoglycerate dehydrogenase / 2-oxoglutarate reductase
MAKPYRVLLYEDMHEAGKKVLAEIAELVMTSSLDEDVLVELARDVHAIIIRANGRVSARIIEAARGLKVIGRHGVGLDGIDLEAAKARGIPVVYTPDANTESVAEQCVGLMMAVSKQIARADKAIRQGRWQVRYEYIGQEMLGRTLGMIGMGRIGGRVAEICHLAFRMPVLYYDVASYPEAENRLAATRLTLNEVLAQADYISVHVPLLPATRGMIGREQFALMKKGAIFINTARGPIVDEPALVQALQNGHLAGAGMDVYAVEPTPADNPLLQLENVVLTPHMSAHTDDALRAMSLVAADVVRVLEGQKPEYRAV